MAAEVLAAVITASGGLAIAGASYWFTKQRERDADLRKEKLDHYKEFTASLGGIIEKEWTAESQRRFAKSCNDLNLIAPQPVIVALQALQDEIRVSNTDRNQERHDRLLSILFYEIRQDLGIAPGDNQGDFRLRLWASGQPPKVQ
jgi:hypothetical protein